MAPEGAVAAVGARILFAFGPLVSCPWLALAGGPGLKPAGGHPGFHEPPPVGGAGQLAGPDEPAAPGDDMLSDAASLRGKTKVQMDGEVLKPAPLPSKDGQYFSVNLEPTRVHSSHISKNMWIYSRWLFCASL